MGGGGDLEHFLSGINVDEQNKPVSIRGTASRLLIIISLPP